MICGNEELSFWETRKDEYILVEDGNIIKKFSKDIWCKEELEDYLEFENEELKEVSMSDTIKKSWEFLTDILVPEQYLIIKGKSFDFLVRIKDYKSKGDGAEIGGFEGFKNGGYNILVKYEKKIPKEFWGSNIFKNRDKLSYSKLIFERGLTKFKLSKLKGGEKKC